MKSTNFLLFVFLFICPMLLDAQTIIGDWSWEGQNQEGAVITNLIRFSEDGTFKVDFATNGAFEVEGVYTYDGKELTLQDTKADSPCGKIVGRYNLSIEGNKASGSLIEDACDIRRETNKASNLMLTKTR